MPLPKHTRELSAHVLTPRLLPDAVRVHANDVELDNGTRFGAITVDRFLLTSDEARQLARTLLRCADELDALHAPIAYALND